MALTTITNSMVSVNAIQGTLIADNAITAVHIATNAVSGTLIADNAITATHIAQNIITVTQLADDAVEGAKIADSVITTNHLNKAMISSQTEVSAVAGDFVLLGDTSDSNNLKKAPISSILAGTLTTAAQTNITSLGTLTTLTVDDITLNGSTLSTPSSLTLDLGGNLTINVDGTVVSLSDDTVNFGQFFNSGAGTFNIYSPTSNQDMVFRGNDGGSGIIALTLDMSAAGAATFNDSITTGGASGVTVTNGHSTFSTGTSWGANLTLKNVNDDSSPPYLSFHKDPSSGYSTIVDNDYVGFINMKAYDDAGNNHTYVEFAAQALDVSNGSESSRLYIGTWNAGTEVPYTLALNKGNVGIGTGSPAQKLHVAGGHMHLDTGMALTWDNTHERIEQSDAKLEFFTNNAQQMTLHGANLGIGTASPSADTGVARFLQIGSSSDAHSGLVLEDNSGQWELQNNADLAFFYDASEKMRIKTDGKVGINRTAPSAKLDVKDQINVTNAENVSLEGLKATRFGYSTGYQLLQIGDGASNVSANIAIGVDLSGNASGSFAGYGESLYFRNGVRLRTPNDANDGFHDYLTLNDGKVGVGINTPASLFEIKQTQSDTMTAATCFLALKGNGGDGMAFGARASSPYAAWIQGGYLPTMGTSNHYPIALNPHGGNIGIGTTSPAANLHVSGANPNNSSDAILYVSKTGGNDFTCWLGSGADDHGLGIRGVGSWAWAVYDHNAGAYRARLQFGGDLYLQNTTVNSISDRRLKKNIVDANSQWNDIKALKWRNFEWKDEYIDGTYLGLIADEVESISPNLVEINAQPKEDIDAGIEDPKHKAVKYSIVWMKAMKALQEAQTRIETLEAKVATLEG
jgi:hypothetical protein